MPVDETWLFDTKGGSISQSLTTQYSVTAYYTFVIAVGADNVMSYNNIERAYYILMLIFGSVMYAYVVSGGARHCLW